MVATNGKSRIVDASGQPLLASPTKGYRSVASGIVYGGIGWTGFGLDFLGGGPLADLPHFTRVMIEAMRRESLCKFATGMVKSPYSSACTLEDPQDRDSGFKGFFVDCPNPAVRRTVEDSMSRIWLSGATQILMAMDYGQTGVEIELCVKRRQIAVECVKEFDPADVTALRNRRSGRIDGCRVRRVPGKSYVDLVDGRGLWITHEPLFGSHVGTPIHLGAYPPWWEKWHHRGAIFSRRLWMLNCAFRGRVVRYPMMVFGTEHGFDPPKTGRDIAVQIVDNCSNGGALAIPNLLDDKGNPLWNTEDPKAMEGGREIKDYPKDLDTEQLRGYGIPDNIITATLQDSTGTYGGRAISFEAFLAMRQQFWTHILGETDRQVIRRIVRWNHGPHADYELRATELMPREKPKERQEQPGGMPGLPGLGDAQAAGDFSRMSFAALLDRHLDEYVERAVGRGTLKASAVLAGRESAERAVQQMSGKNYACVLCPLPGKLADRIVELGESIGPDDLADKGIERDPHITVKYGLHSDDPATVASVLAGFGPVTVRLGAVGILPAVSDGADVLKVDVKSDDLERLNQLIASSVGNTETHAVFNPHITIGYVKPGSARELIGDMQFDGIRITFDSVVFSSRDGTTQAIPLGVAATSGAVSQMAATEFREDDHPRGQPDNAGQFASEPQGETSSSSGKSAVAVGFASPNKRIKLTFRQAVQDLGSHRQKRIRKRFEHIDTTLQIPHQSFDIIGDWETGAENAVLTQYSQYADFEELMYAMAWKGLVAGQLSVLLFEERAATESPHMVYLFAVDDTMESIRRTLQRAGVYERSLLPTTSGQVQVYVVDLENKYAAVVDVAKHYDTKLDIIRGFGTYLPSEWSTREHSATFYRHFISGYEKRLPHRRHYRIPQQRLSQLRGPNAQGRTPHRPVMIGIGLRSPDSAR